MNDLFLKTHEIWTESVGNKTVIVIPVVKTEPITNITMSQNENSDPIEIHLQDFEHRKIETNIYFYIDKNKSFKQNKINFEVTFNNFLVENGVNIKKISIFEYKEMSKKIEKIINKQTLKRVDPIINIDNFLLKVEAGMFLFVIVSASSMLIGILTLQIYELFVFLEKNPILNILL